MTALVVTSEEEECGRMAQFQRPQVQYTLKQKEGVGVNRRRSGHDIDNAAEACFPQARGEMPFLSFFQAQAPTALSIPRDTFGRQRILHRRSEMPKCMSIDPATAPPADD